MQTSKCFVFVWLFYLRQRNVLRCNCDWKETKGNLSFDRLSSLVKLSLYNNNNNFNERLNLLFGLCNEFCWGSTHWPLLTQLFLTPLAPKKLIRMTVCGIIWLFVTIIQSTNVNKLVLLAIEFSVRGWTPLLSLLTRGSKRRCTLIALVKIFVSCVDFQIKSNTNLLQSKVNRPLESLLWSLFSFRFQETIIDLDSNRESWRCERFICRTSAHQSS